MIRVLSLAGWPVRRILRTIRRWQRGQIYGWRAPRRWPAGWRWPGPRDPHAGRSVVIFAAGRRCEFSPVTFGRYLGHVYPGTVRATEADIAGRLNRLGLPVAVARPLAIVSGFEGGYDAIQTYDGAKFCWGFVQFAATGGLPRLLHAIRTTTPDVFTRCFGAVGIDVDMAGITVQRGGAVLRGRRAIDALHDDPSLWTPFILASSSSDVQDTQVRLAYENYYAHPMNTRVQVAGRVMPLADLIGDDEFGRALVLDRAVHRGVGHVLWLFRRAIARAQARGVADVAAVVAAVRAIDARDHRRITMLETRVSGGIVTEPLASIGQPGFDRLAR